ncbi:betaine/proline/choline family ABC transporter ATP-binding protein [Bacillaceae bacterium SIJ1]|uniref:ABC transporter ATP-binding protein n=1 Tax=Litoribacterium kuwaitense TaxID=1398745 RepID=UPI0013EE0A5D|nr:ABC transporter ATP-binding protein [Litoribacterium kuwaitense]NGP44020.1 betaine/proline/choline family ABC transporter ATP-binding protein [Litoribacterium kuwaitense]
MISFRTVKKQYKDGTEALKDIDMTINEGEFFVLIGPSGCGKTTTLKMINRLEEPTSGHIELEGKELSQYALHELRWNIGYVLQQIALFPHMTIAENIAVVPEMKKWSKDRTAKRIDELLNMVGLDPKQYRDRRPEELSGGQQQRVGVVRALAADPNIILMDEPFSALDPLSRNQLQNDILEIQQKIQKTIVFVTHDIDEAMKLGDRICVMKKGVIEQVGTPNDIVYQPANDFVESFVSQAGSKHQVHKMLSSLPSLSSEHIIRDNEVDQAKFQRGIWFVSNADHEFLYVLEEGQHVNIQPLSSDMRLTEALKRMDESRYGMLPVMHQDKLSGILTYKHLAQGFIQEERSA